jgi:hypothetical protein
MFLTRWKLMAGVLAVSLGGLAAMAGQCTKSEPTKGAPPPPPEMPTASAPSSTPVMPPPAAPSLPPIPAPESTKAPVAPPVLPVIQAGGLPPVPSGPPNVPIETPSVPPIVSQPEPMIPATDLRQFLPSPSTSAPTPPAAPSPSASNLVTPPMNVPADPLLVDTAPSAPVYFVKPAASAPAHAATAAVQAKYRILLRVGEGEPIFEVRSGDDLILKVVCEKVDVKSPEKGQGLSAVKAYGKVRFAGFGAEGTCDELNFLAGTGEVAMAGHVQIRVKDKLGRVESELSADTMRYRIDPHAIAGSGLLKP